MNWRLFVVDRLHDAYGLANRLGVLDNPVMGDLFVRSYFAYKRLGDPFDGLTRMHPELFQGGHIVDIGANVGYTAAVFARALAPGYKVFAFEPARSNFDRLVRTLGRLGLTDRAEAIHAAVGASEGTVGLWHNVRHHAGHRISTDAFRAGHGAAVENVPITSIDRFVQDRSIGAAVRFVKIDVEGYETAVCEGMAATVRDNPEICVALEYAPEAIRELGFAPRALIEFFRVRSFVIHVLDASGGVEAIDAAHADCHLGARGYVDLLCARRRLGA